jgi:hypothetical protein
MNSPTVSLVKRSDDNDHHLTAVKMLYVLDNTFRNVNPESTPTKPGNPSPENIHLGQAGHQYMEGRETLMNPTA